VTNERAKCYCREPLISVDPLGRSLSYDNPRSPRISRAAMSTLECPSVAQSRKSFSSIVVMLIGSSMTQKAFDVTFQGFGIGLADWYSRIADIIVRGQSGYNSRWTLQGLPEIIGPYKADITTIFLGNNDATTVGGQFVPLDEFQVNVMKIIEMLRERNPVMSIILITPTRANKTGRSDELTNTYADVIRELASKVPNVALLDLWIDPYSITADDLCDGLHLNEAGNHKVLRGLLDTIRKHYPQFVPFNDEVKTESAISVEGNVVPKLQWLFPKWNNLAGKSIEESSELIERSPFL
jgi:isoamyl acetate esterase